MLMRVAVGIHGKDIDAAIETYDLLSGKWFTHASPTLFNAATCRPQLSRFVQSLWWMLSQRSITDCGLFSVQRCRLLNWSFTHFVSVDGDGWVQVFLLFKFSHANYFYGVRDKNKHDLEHVWGTVGQEWGKVEGLLKQGMWQAGNEICQLFLTEEKGFWMVWENVVVLRELWTGCEKMQDLRNRTIRTTYALGFLFKERKYITTVLFL